MLCTGLRTASSGLSANGKTDTAGDKGSLEGERTIISAVSLPSTDTLSQALLLDGGIQRAIERSNEFHLLDSAG